MSTDYRKYILSTGTHYISNSGSDENGGTHGGAAGGGGQAGDTGAGRSD